MKAIILNHSRMRSLSGLLIHTFRHSDPSSHTVQASIKYIRGLFPHLGDAAHWALSNEEPKRMTEIVKSRQVACRPACVPGCHLISPDLGLAFGSRSQKASSLSRSTAKTSAGKMVLILYAGAYYHRSQFTHTYTPAFGSPGLADSDQKLGLTDNQTL